MKKEEMILEIIEYLNESAGNFSFLLTEEDAQRIANELSIKLTKDTRLWVDEGHVEGLKKYSKEKALSVIRDVLIEDTDLLDVYGGDVNKVSEDNLFQIARNHYNIHEIN